MIKPELIQAIANKTRIPKNKIELVVDTMLDTIVNEVKDGEKVLISGFGVFHLTQRKARSGINPNTKEKIQVEGMQLPKFRAGEKFKRAVRNKK
ncbi:MAG: HU family DNA-binding protein [Candidatus Saccharibacteria bacterium]|jgi:DNA-binding protein HU-beta|nr:HU family DNA-binding protein [Patescibacteria group bacterium]